jgi:hypothetical protein
VTCFFVVHLMGKDLEIETADGRMLTTIPECTRHASWSASEEKMTFEQIKDAVIDLVTRTDDQADNWNLAGYLLLLASKAVDSRVENKADFYNLPDSPEHPGDNFSEFKGSVEEAHAHGGESNFYHVVESLMPQDWDGDVTHPELQHVYEWMRKTYDDAEKSFLEQRANEQALCVSYE